MARRTSGKVAFPTEPVECPGAHPPNPGGYSRTVEEAGRIGSHGPPAAPAPSKGSIAALAAKMAGGIASNAISGSRDDSLFVLNELQRISRESARRSVNISALVFRVGLGCPGSCGPRASARRPGDWVWPDPAP